MQLNWSYVQKNIHFAQIFELEWATLHVDRRRANQRPSERMWHPADGAAE